MTAGNSAHSIKILAQKTKLAKHALLLGIKVTWFLTLKLLLLSHIIILKHRPCTKRSSSVLVLLLLVSAITVWNQVNEER